MTKFAIAAAATLLAAPVFAEGDAAEGEAQFNRQCVACHVVADESGEVLAGRAARTGPNLYGVAGRTLGSVEDFRYGDPLIQLGEDGMAWNEDLFVVYVQDPTSFLREQTNDQRARSKMSYRVRSEEDAANIWAFLSTFGGEAEEEGESDESN